MARSALAGAITLAVLFALCWVAAATNVVGGSQIYVSLFTLSPAPSTAALLAGLGWSLAFGALAGGLVAVAYNALAFIDRP